MDTLVDFRAVITLKPGKEGKTKVSPKRNLNWCQEFQPDICHISICDSSKMLLLLLFSSLFYPQNTVTTPKRSMVLLTYRGPPHAGQFPKSSLISSEMREQGEGTQEEGQLCHSEEFPKGPCLEVSASPSFVPCNRACH